MNWSGKPVRVLLLNQYGPPDSPPTARLLGELAEFLRSQGHEATILSQTQSYQGRPASGGGRLRREVAALLGILRTGWRRGPARPDLVLALSSPPGLLVVAALLAWRHRARLAHWAMDLYPELAVTLHEIPPGPPARAVQFLMNQAYRRAALVVALDDDMRAHLQPLCRATVRVLEPWPAAGTERQLADLTTAAPSPPQNHAPWTWLYSGNLGRAHEWQTLLDAQRLLEDRGAPVHLIFQGDGAARAAAAAYAEQIGLRACAWKGYVPEDDLLSHLLRAQVLIATQRPETRGLLWPSKLAVLERLPRPILFVGPTTGAIARRLTARGSAGVFAPGEAGAVANWIEQRHAHAAHALSSAEPRGGRLEGCATLESWLKECLRA